MNARVYTIVIVFGWAAFLIAAGNRAAGAQFEWRPVDSTGLHSFNGSEIVLQGGGQQVILELRISGWDPEHDSDPTLGAYQATLDSATLGNGVGAPLSALVTPNPEAGGFIVTKRCTFGQLPDPNGQPCDTSACPQGEFCIDNHAFVFANLNPVFAVSTATPDYAFGAAVQALQGKADNGTTYYAGTLILVVPATASGTYNIGFLDDPNYTFMNNFLAGYIQVDSLVPGRITVNCATAADCDDANGCTTDTCRQGACLHSPNFNTATFCCNPADGSTVPLTDNNVCTQDVCNPATGVVTHPAGPAGTACGSQATSECDRADQCDGAGACSPRYSAAGTRCGSATTTPCDRADSCDGQGSCRQNLVPDGGTCNDNIFCTVGETCTGGVCGGGSPNVPNPQCSGDFDIDGDRALDDFAALFDCLAGPDAPHPGGDCAIGDFDGGGEVDLLDVAAFQNVFTGGQTPP